MLMVGPKKNYLAQHRRPEHTLSYGDGAADPKVRRIRHEPGGRECRRTAEAAPTFFYAFVLLGSDFVLLLFGRGTN